MSPRLTIYQASVPPKAPANSWKDEKVILLLRYLPCHWDMNDKSGGVEASSPRSL